MFPSADSFMSLSSETTQRAKIYVYEWSGDMQQEVKGSDFCLGFETSKLEHEGSPLTQIVDIILSH